MMVDFIRNENVISNQPTRNKRRLSFTYQRVHMRLRSISEAFRRNFVSNITQTYRPELSIDIRVSALKNQDNMSIVQFNIKDTLIQKVYTILNHKITNSRPELLEK